MIQIPYGLKDNKRVHISDVDRGLTCGAVCYDCGALLVAHKGDIIIHHFKHKNKTENCNTSLETLMHKIAKEIINEYKSIMLPSVQSNGEQIFAAQKMQIDKVTLEHKLGSIVPDIICEIRNKELIIEIKVTNPISVEKRKKIEELKIATIEIELNVGLLFLSDTDVKDAVLYRIENRKWIYNEKNFKSDKESIQYKQSLKAKSILRPWRERANGPIKQVHCLNDDYFDILISRYKADLSRHCKSCKFYIDHDINGVYCIFGVENLYKS